MATRRMRKGVDIQYVNVGEKEREAMRPTYAFVYVFGAVYKALEPSSVSQYLQLWQLAVLLSSFFLLTPARPRQTDTNKRCCYILILLSSLSYSHPISPSLCLHFFFLRPLPSLLILSLSLSLSLQRGISVGQVPCHGLLLYNVCFVCLVVCVCVCVCVGESLGVCSSRNSDVTDR